VIAGDERDALSELAERIAVLAVGCEGDTKLLLRALLDELRTATAEMEVAEC
jgi:hypothetical protein